MGRISASSLITNRRSMLLGSAAALIGTNLFADRFRAQTLPDPSTAGAAMDDVDFLSLSHVATGHSDLSSVTAARIFGAMRKFDPNFSTRAAALLQLARSATEPEALLQAAEPAGLGDTMQTIVAAWYTGTVGKGTDAVVVSYVDALMYQPVKDGMRPPTYCDGPNWWTGSPPLAGVLPPAPERMGRDMKKPVFASSGDASADIIVVGSGAVGAMIADHLVDKGHSVLILEAGPRIDRATAVENWRNMPFANRLGSDFQGLFPQSPYAPAPLYFPENNYVGFSGPDGSGFKQGYLRVVGGTTWHWAASCWRHLSVDFRMNSTYGVGRDWPISYDDLEPYYCKAEEEMGVAGPNDPAQQSPSERSKPYPMDIVPWNHGDKRFAEVVNAYGYRSVPIPQARSTRPWNGRPTCCGNNNCQPICPIGAMYSGIHHVQRAERKGVVVVSEAVVYKIDTDENNRVTVVHWYDVKRSSRKATGRSFVLACNSLETPRLLLIAANERNPNGIANSSDQVGRNMMDHSGFHCTFLANEPLWIGRGLAQNS